MEPRTPAGQVATWLAMWNREDDPDITARWSTHSGHRLLPTEVADELHGTLIDQLGGAEQLVTLHDVTMALTARRH